MKLCEKCKNNKIPVDTINSILQFPFKKFETKESMRNELTKFMNTEKLLVKNEKYNSNIIHELVYNLVKAKYTDKLYRKQHIWALEILSDLPEYPILLSEKNCKNEIPIESYIRLIEDNHSKQYQEVLKLLQKNSPIQIIFINNNSTNITNEVVNKLIIKENEKKKIHPLVPVITNQYHTLQTKLFQYLETYYSNYITKCESCNLTIDLFNDLEAIGTMLKQDKNRLILVKNIEHILNLRKKAIELSVDDDVNRRHKHIITYFESLLYCLNVN